MGARGTGRRDVELFNGDRFRFGKTKSSGDGWWGRVHGTVGVLNAA